MKSDSASLSEAPLWLLPAPLLVVDDAMAEANIAGDAVLDRASFSPRSLALLPAVLFAGGPPVVAVLGRGGGCELEAPAANFELLAVDDEGDGE